MLPPITAIPGAVEAINKHVSILLLFGIVFIFLGVLICLVWWWTP